MNEEINLIDDCFYVKKGRFLWYSFLKDNTPLITSLTEEICIFSTRMYLKQKQEGFSETEKSYEGSVGGKL